MMSEPLYDWLTSSQFDRFSSDTDAKVAISYFNKKMCGVALRTHVLHCGKENTQYPAANLYNII